MKRKKKVLTTEHSISVKDSSNSPPGMIFDFGQWNERPYSENWIKQLAYDLLQWAENDEDALVLDEFYTRKHIRATDINRLNERWPYLLEAKELAKRFIGIRREKGALKRKLDAGMVMQSMPLYSVDWDELQKRKYELMAKAKDLANMSNGPAIVVIEKFPSSDIVPERKKEE